MESSLTAKEGVWSRLSTSFLLVVLLCLLLYSPSVLCGSSDLIQPECLKVPSSQFVSSLRSTIDAVGDVIVVVSKFVNLFGDFRVSNAVSDCLDLLDLSADELDRTLSASQNYSGKYSDKTGNLGADLRTWLSAALGNQDTCEESFEGTDSFIKGIISGSLRQVTSLIRDILGMVRQVSEPNSNLYPGNKKRKLNNFPYWFKDKRDRKLLVQQQTNVEADAVVAADGSGNFAKIMDAVSAAPDHSMRRYVIYVKKGVYTENVEISKKKWNLMMIGDGMDVTVVSGNRNFVDGWTTYRSATFAVKGQGFIARDMTFENRAGPEKHQAVAFRSDSDLSVIFRCGIRGYQDTLYAHSMRQFYRECHITGTVDFMFGDATVVFQNCQIQARKGLPNQKNTITAQGRKDPMEPTGFSIQFCNVTAEENTTAYLGRPWKLYSRTIFMQSYLSATINPKGWLEWNGDFALETLFYAEYLNYGTGAAVGGRITWPGFHSLNDSSQANNFTVSQFILGNSWLPSTGVKYTAGLVV